MHNHSAAGDTLLLQMVGSMGGSGEEDNGSLARSTTPFDYYLVRPQLSALIIVSSMPFKSSQCP